jgi:2,4-dienoyl-CoA reductase-like NADH-dependent reductase (Old Yellow Enzyme family)
MGDVASTSAGASRKDDERTVARDAVVRAFGKILDRHTAQEILDKYRAERVALAVDGIADPAVRARQKEVANEAVDADLKRMSAPIRRPSSAKS